MSNPTLKIKKSTTHKAVPPPTATYHHAPDLTEAVRHLVADQEAPRVATPPDFAEYFGWNEKRTGKLTTYQLTGKDSSTATTARVYAESVGKHAFIQINKYIYKILHVETDAYENDVERFEALSEEYFHERGLPVPNAAVVTERGFHLFYFLNETLPVKYRTKRHGVFDHARGNLLAAINGDYNCNRRSFVRNPFHKSEGHTPRLFHSNPIDLEKLIVSPPEPQKKSDAHNVSSCKKVVQNSRFHFVNGNVDDAYYMGNRDNATFIHAIDLYQANKRIGLRRLVEQVTKWVHSHVDEKPLKDSTIAKKCMQAMKGYNRPSGQPERKNYNYGAAGLQRIETAGKSRAQVRREVKKHKKAGALYTAATKRNQTQDELQKAVDKYKELYGHRPTQKELAQATKRGIATVKRHWKGITK